jgi:predicted secreted hydrolase
MNITLIKRRVSLKTKGKINTWNMVFLVLLMLLFTSACSDEEATKRSPLKGLGDATGAFEKPSRSNVIEFPTVHAPQKSYQQEWWYLTANLTTESGEALATQWTLFRRGVESKHWYFAHAALADAQHHQSAFRSARETLGNLTISSKVTATEAFNAKIDDWQWQSTQGLLPANLHYGNFVGLATEGNISNEPVKSRVRNTVKKTEKDKQLWQVNLDLTLDENSTDEQKPHYFLQGDDGYSQKHQSLAIASHYYSQPFIKVSGEVYWQNKWQKVTGNAWFDREWGSQMLAEDQQGWDWFSLRLNENTALMVYRIRSSDKDFLYGSLMQRDGSIQTLSSEDIVIKSSFSSQSVTNAAYPDSFSIEIAQKDIDIEVKVINKSQIMRFGIEYFEGMVSFSGSHRGQGFLEMTGYE